MGVIRQQTIRGTFFTYLGALLGVLTNLILLAWFFTPEQIGLLNILVAYSLLFAQFANLGFDNVTIRLFPFFRDDKTKHNGYFAIMLKVIILGSLISFLLFYLTFPYISTPSDGDLFSKYGFYVFPLILVTLFFNSFETYSRVLYKSVRGTFIKEVLQRILIILVIALYLWFKLSFELFVLLYVIVFSLPTVILFFILYKEGSVTFKINKSFISQKLKKEMYYVSLFGLITVFGSTIVSNIDKIMIQQYLDLYQTGLYSIAFFFGVIITMPSRALTKISSTVVAESWKNNDIQTINTIYYKSCINQMIFSLLLFIGVWANIDNLLKLLPEKYAHIHWVIFWIGLGSFIDMATGINNTIIGTSPKYKIQSLFMMIFIVIIVLSNAIFIPLYGITGAAFASALSLFVFNFVRWFFLWKYYSMQPFNYKFALVLLIGAFVYFINLLIPQMQFFYTDIILRSFFVAIIYITLIWFFKLSDDFNERINVYVNIIKQSIK